MWMTNLKVVCLVDVASVDDVIFLVVKFQIQICCSSVAVGWRWCAFAMLPNRLAIVLFKNTLAAHFRKSAE